jgi:hypothetical protein
MRVEHGSRDTEKSTPVRVLSGARFGAVGLLAPIGGLVSSTVYTDLAGTIIIGHDQRRNNRANNRSCSSPSPYPLRPFKRSAAARLQIANRLSVLQRHVPTRIGGGTEKLADCPPPTTHTHLLTPGGGASLNDIADGMRYSPILAARALPGRTEEFLEGFSRLSPRVMGVKSIGGGLWLPHVAKRTRGANMKRG